MKTVASNHHDSSVRDTGAQSEYLTANKRHYRLEDSLLHDAYNKLLEIIPGKHSRPLQWQAQSDHLLAVSEALASELGLTIKLSDAIKAGHYSKKPLWDIAAASQFKARKIVLKDDWYKKDGGSFVGWLSPQADDEHSDGTAGESDRAVPVALLQRRPGRYVMYNPVDDSYQDVTRKLAHSIMPSAVMFYRHFKNDPVVLKEVLAFAVKGTSRYDWIWILLLGLGGGLLALLTPVFTSLVFDIALPDGNSTMLNQLCFLMVFIALTSFIFDITRMTAVQRLTGYMERDVQAAVWDRLLSLPVGFFRQFSSGELTQRALGIERIRAVLSNSVVNLLLTGIFSLVYIGMLFFMGGTLAWPALGILLVVLLLSFLFGALHLRFAGEQLDSTNKLSGRMFEWLSGFTKIKISGAEKRIYYNWTQDFSKARRLAYKKGRVANGVEVFSAVIPLLSSIVIYAAFSSLEMDISVGSFIAFTVAFQGLIGSVLLVSATLLQTNEIISLYQKLVPIFEATPEYDELKDDPGVITGALKLNNIGFRYTEDSPLVLNDVSFSVAPGEHVALVGPSGSGKSTLLRLLLGFEKATTGEIFVDGRDITHLDIRLIRQQIGVVLQTEQLLEGSIFQNVAGTNPDATEADAQEALERVGMAETLAGMPMGLHTVISEGAGTISGGQRQQIMIARALIKKPKILFFDEATSALDNTSQHQVMDSINRLNTTRLTIAHRLSTVRECNRIIVLVDGAIAEQGSYDELMARDGVFAKMARRQIV
jgi:ATP-binding cassette subfamily C protein